MSRHVKTTIRYDGPALVGHDMDVQDLAPALLALADIIQIANRKFNGDSASIKVLVNADIEQKCFQLDVSLVQSMLDQAATLLGQKDVVTVKEIAEWIGLIVTTSTSLFGIWRWISGQKSEGGVTFEVGDVAGTTVIIVNGSGNSITVPSGAAALLADDEVTKHVKSVLKPLEKEGYNDMSFLFGDKEVVKIDETEARKIISSPSLIQTDDPHQSISKIRGIVRIKSPQYEGSAKWSLLWNGRIIEAEMSEEAAEWVKKFQSNNVNAPPGTVLDVTMSEMVKLNLSGTAVSKPSYVVMEVHDWTPPPKQGRFDFGFSKRS
jgi:hypothetical protein